MIKMRITPFEKIWVTEWLENNRSVIVVNANWTPNHRGIRIICLEDENGKKYSQSFKPNHFPHGEHQACFCLPKAEYFMVYLYQDSGVDLECEIDVNIEQKTHRKHKPTDRVSLPKVNRHL